MPEVDKENEPAAEAAKESKSTKKVPRNRILCRITCLDKNFLTAEMPKSAKGLDLMRRVCDQLNLQEREYFGLLFNYKKEKYWLDPRKVIKTQLKGSKPEFQLAVKFYEPFPGKLKSDYTRYMLCLQVRDDINCERLPCSFGAQALLGSYIVQGELGDYDYGEHTGNYLEGMVFGPSQTEELVDKIKELHKVNRGMSPAQCDMQYLEAARKLTMYGIDAHPATDGNNDEILIGVSHAGVSIFKDDLRQNRFPWQKVIEVLYKGKQFSVKSRPGELEQLVTTMTFNMPSEKAAKRLYKSCVEHHTFFRLSYPDPPPSATDTLLKKGSKFRYSDRTLYQIRKEGVAVNQDPPKFMRVSSRNWSERYEPATTEIIVVADEERRKRPHDKRHGGQDKKHKGERVAPLSEEEMMTMTPEERAEYKRKMAERLGTVTTTTTTTTTVYYPGQEEDEEHIKARKAGELESGQVAYGVGEDAERARVIALKEEEEREKKRRQEEEERERKRKEEEERERKRKEEERERERREREREEEKEREREREREKRRRELERLAAADRADIAARKPPTETLLYKTSSYTPQKDEAELLEFSFATPVTSGDTIKRAKMKQAETDSYKGRVARVQDEPDTKPAPAPAPKPKPKRDDQYRGHATLPPRTHGVHSTGDDDDDRRKSADDMDDRRGKGVPLITKEELIRSYSPAGSKETSKPEPKRPSQKERESDQVASNIKRYSYGKELEDRPATEVRTEKVVIGPGGESRVYSNKTPPEVKTQSYTISSVGGPVKAPVQENVSRTETSRVQSSPEGGTAARVVTSHIPSVSTQRIVYDQPVAPSPVKDIEGGTIVTRTVTIDGSKRTDPIQTQTIKHTTMPTEIITKTITIEGDGGPLTAEELKEIMAQQGANFDSEVITTTYSTTTKEHRVERTISEKTSLVDEQGNVISTGDPDTDRAIEEAIRQAKEADPNVKVTEVMISRNDESIA